MQFECDDAEDVLSAALRNNIILLSECHKGICTTCRVHCSDGEFELGRGVSVYSLPPEDQDEGFTLLCQTYPRSDLEIQLPYGLDRVSFGTSRIEEIYEARIAVIERFTEHVVSIFLELRDEFGKPRDFRWTPGQYIKLRVPGTGEWRSYSMANIPDGSGRVELMVRLLEDGVFSNYLRERVKVGQVVEIKGPYGEFQVHASVSPRYFVGGSTGLAPLVSMLRGMAEANDPAPCRLIFGMRSQEFFFYAKELAALAGALPALSLELSLETPDPEWTGRVGNVGEVLSVILNETGEKPDIYVCGPGPMVRFVEEICHARGVRSDRVFSEKFLASG
ncbi:MULTISPECIES: 2Fe-2S iron-sulfur cluster binding domain-containing protein [Xanthobacter]|uniref:2Fe-2S iron-sulfur cluster binding domain-containing protein n=1 Tax=Xanthobacter TaxID=279 RepID=UPI0024A6B9EE|nr:2Fe-2S iron-sulfur cluster binding domain-containing protein [Xanthobacter autotrophicus]